MFSGIIEVVGKVYSKNISLSRAEFSFKANAFNLAEVQIGNSIAINGACLTVTTITGDYFSVDVSLETLKCSTFKNLKVGDLVNFEKALKINHRIEGHLVSGHVDAVGEIVLKYNDGSSVCLKIKIPDNLVKYIASKGSICVNGVSLTVNYIKYNVFNINIVPHTLKSTTLSKCRVGDMVNIEIDLIARYVEKLISCNSIDNYESYN